jgi:WD40 repeat protein
MIAVLCPNRYLTERTGRLAATLAGVFVVLVAGCNSAGFRTVPAMKYRVHEGRQIFRVNFLTSALALSPRGERLALAGPGREIQVVELAEPDRPLTAPSPSDRVLTYAWSPDGRLLVLNGVDFTLYVYDAETLQYRWKRAGVFGVDWAPNGSLVTSTHDGSLDGAQSVLFLHANDGRQLGDLPGFSGADVSPDGKRALVRSSPPSGEEESSDRIIALPDGRLIADVDRRVERGRIAWKPDGSSIVIGGPDPIFRAGPNAWLIDAASGKVLVAFPDYYYGVRAVRWSPDGDMFCMTHARNDGRTDVIQIHRDISGEVVAELRGPEGHIVDINWREHYRIRAVAIDREYNVEVWEWELP